MVSGRRLPAIRRRTLLGLPPGLLAAAALLPGCGGPPGGPVRELDRPGEGRVAYGDGPSQFGELYLPEGEPRGVVVVVHGGFWRTGFDLSLGAPLATDLAARGWAAWNLEYRRVGGGDGGGGGASQTCDDVAAGIDALADLDLGSALDTVVTLGHSAGGHLAAWAASRERFERWQPARVAVTHVVSQAGVLDLRAAEAAGLGGGAVSAFLGGSPDDAAAAPFDPARQLPLDVPVWCVHGEDDTIVPPSQSADYVRAATDAGAVAELVSVPGDHFAVIDVSAPAWERSVAILDSLP